MFPCILLSHIQIFGVVVSTESIDRISKAVRKAKFFLHPDKLPKDLTENPTLLFKTIWNAIQEQEAAALG